ncbi:hypothetical protein PPYR_10905 [Photinus pyralis]|uniref:MULE transposase domain-containing protein n=1 Tax=Photinus pyralis TaxID=7054 RepID=A0A5N4AHQ8_PHOPY|nr:hypothetical protein PPYR_10905 [Photinus pyralis]
MKVRAANCVENPRQIIQHCSNGLALGASVHLPTYTASQRAIERVRKRAEQPYPNPTAVADITIPTALQTTSRNANFLLWDSGAEDPNRIFMFGTEQNLNILEQHRHWFVDGTFKVAPELFLQVFTIHALVENTCMPLVYVLLQDKSEMSYVRVFQKLLDLKITLNPISVTSDFEKAIHNAVSRVFDEVQIVGCLFHLGQSLWRRVQLCNLTEDYLNNENVSQHTKMLLSLSFVPPNDVIMAFEELVENCPNTLDPIVDYWEDTYIGRLRRNRRGDPRFPIAIWNVYNRVADRLPRTNNSVEGWHRAFQQTLNCHHPSVYKLIDQFKKEQDHVEILHTRITAGIQHPESSKRKYVQLNRRLEVLTDNYDNTAVMDYLRGISHNMEI